jgi:hypothetical protein
MRLREMSSWVWICGVGAFLEFINLLSGKHMVYHSIVCSIDVLLMLWNLNRDLKKFNVRIAFDRKE